MHFFNPVPVMKLVGVIRGLETTDDTFAEVKALAESVRQVAGRGAMTRRDSSPIACSCRYSTRPCMP